MDSKVRLRSQRRLLRLVAVTVVALLALTMVLAASAQAANFTITGPSDGAGSCDTSTHTCTTLRAGINDSAAGDTVLLLPGSYTLDPGTSLGDLIINKNLTIRGPSPRTTTIDASGTSGDRVFTVESGTVTIAGVQISGGGGGSVDDSSGNSGPGGGIWSASGTSLTLDHVTVDNNTAGTSGGGIDTDGSLTVTNSTIANNLTNPEANNLNGGGIDCDSSCTGLSLTNTTIWGNGASTDGGGVYVGASGLTAKLTNVTIAQNDAANGSGGGFFGGAGSLGAVNTIIANNVSNTADPGDCAGSPSGSLGHNISSDSNCGFTASGDKQGTDPLLSSLVDNGGDTDTTDLLSTSSPAIDAGSDASCPASDQRGTTRPQGSHCDIGAIEFVPPQLQIASSGPLSGIFINRGLECQVAHVGDLSPEFFGDTSTGACGTFLSLRGQVYGPTDLPVGPTSAPPTGPISFVPQGQTLSGSGTAADPFTILTNVTIPGRQISITETDTYITGQDFYSTTIVIQNNTGAAISPILYHGGDCFLGNEDQGYGDFGDVFGGAISCTKTPNDSPAGAALSLVPTGGSSDYFEGDFSTNWANIVSGKRLPNTCDCSGLQDNGASLGWNVGSIAAGAKMQESLETHLVPAGPNATTNAATGVGTGGATLHGSVSANGTDTRDHFEYGTSTAYGNTTPPDDIGAGFSDQPASAVVNGLAPGTTYHYRVVAVNSNNETAFGADRTFTTSGSAPGSGGGGGTTTNPVQQPPPQLPQQQQQPPGPPKEGVDVNAFLVSGQVFVKVPAGFAKSRNRWLAQAAAGFVPLTSIGRQVPVGSTLDTTAGTVRLFAATNSLGTTTQSGDFSKGFFIVEQAHTNPLTTLSMTGGNLNSCTKVPHGGSAKTIAAARGRGRSLFSNVHGRFRTRGRNSSATVRGTEYLVKDTCSGTFTSVRRGTVTVRDFTLRKNVTVKAHHKYLARPPKRK